ncbi:MAG: DUF530 family protein, partial [Candidatus Micrarchaeota archaeon]|nr:DUF530 family protein [Candidatus Micrarchaeota archaeon]
MISSQQVIAAANRFLDGRMAAPVGRQDFEKNAGEIAGFRDTMLYLGFNSPFSNLLLQSRSEIEEFSEGESADLKKQLGKMRDLANAKKFTLNRARVALTANRIAADVFPL